MGTALYDANAELARFEELLQNGLEVDIYGSVPLHAPAIGSTLGLGVGAVSLGGHVGLS